MTRISRQVWLAALLLAVLLLAACGGRESQRGEWAADSGSAPKVIVNKSPTCGCCDDWSGYLENNDFPVQTVKVENLATVKARYRVPLELQSCHTAIVDGYVVEGHVPIAEINRLLAERPADIVGLAVPGMPIGSPGMEVESAQPQPYEVIAWTKSGEMRVYATYP